MNKLKPIRSVLKSSTATLDPNVEATLSKISSQIKLKHLFPWRERPNNKQSLIQSFSFELWRKYKLVFGTHSKIANDREIECGAGKAFAMSLEAIFDHRLVTNVLVRDENNKAHLLRKNDTPFLSDIFEKKLADFYEHAILKFTLNNLHDIGYSLVQINSPKIVKREIIIGVRREGSIQRLKKPYYWKTPLGISFVLDRQLFSERSVDFVEAARSSWLSGELTVRYWVDLECTGQFESVLESLSSYLTNDDNHRSIFHSR
jgi:hypothetical protein